MKKEKKNLGIYIHIPFCKSKCAYCDFYSLAKREDQMDAYVEALIRHMSEVAPQMESCYANSVYFGGGTPSYLGVERLKRILKEIYKKFNIEKSAEVTIEANPDSIQSKADVKALKKLGVNRISLGVQSTDDSMLQKLGRAHNYQDVKAAVKAIRDAKIDNLSIDLIYGLPGQTIDQWKRTLEEALFLEPEHISCYGLKIEEGTPFFEHKNELVFPSDDEQADMYFYAVEYLLKFGFHQYEISNFAKPGFESVHNLKYWQQEEYIGFGPGAHSDTGNCRFAYKKDLDGYIEGTLELSEREECSERERDSEYIMLSMRTAKGINRHHYESSLRQKFAPLEKVFEKLEKEQYAVRTEEGWRLTPKGMYVSNSIILLLQEAASNDKSRRIEEAAKGNFMIEM